ncbi:SPOR domain-containing protein [Fibrella sp. HMF5335]|uniref:SPOR domain-containing protein n=1 Tax=Fibrella rubiginis TaxID=2817060 RepID=A0A939GDV6_9BACT|nr:SPOR domain-containing protein [Fibrella rubiginis]MBO0935968.1 SPOR domain-containing protein [Fibrella rubiginis]
MTMQPIGDYLKKLLYQYDCLVVPGLGAFLTHAVSASYNERDGLFLPPRRRLAFNEAMRLDDGILVNYLMFHERCNREAALNHIDAFVQEIKQTAQQQGSYSIDGIGLFSLNAENSLQFDPELRHNFLSSAYGLGPVQYQTIPVLLTQPMLEAAGEPKRNPLFVAAVDSADDDVPVLEMPVRQLSPGWRWAAVAFLAGSLGFISYFTVLHPNQGLQSSLNPASMFRVFAPASMPTWSRATAAEDVKPSAAVVTPSVPAVPVEEELGNGMTTAVPTPAPSPDAPAAKKPDLAPEKEVVAVAVPTPTVEPVAVKASLPIKAAVAPVKKAVKTNRVVVRPFGGSPYALVVGSFANRNNALRLRKRLVAAGYTDAAILPTHKGELIKVAALGAATLSEAAAHKDSLTQFTGTHAIIVRNR